MANRFKDPAMRREYVAAMQAYLRRQSALFGANGAREQGTAMARSFWDGFDGKSEGERDKRAKSTLVYAYWRAGQDAARRAQASRRAA